MKYLFFGLFLSFSAFATNFFNIEVESIDGEKFKMEKYKDKVILVVNIASQCGFTSQLEDLEKLHKAYEKKGLVVLGVPSNEFREQTPESDQEMKEFCQKKYSVTFPLLKKSIVTGKDKMELYKYLTNSNKKFEGDPGWNFVKFLVSKDGKLVDRFTSMVNPSSSSIKEAIEKELK
jgi:glutathione peroxidase